LCLGVVARGAPGAEVLGAPVVAVAVEVVELELVVSEAVAAVEASVDVCGEAFGSELGVALGLPVRAVPGGGVPGHRGVTVGATPGP
jgi:hypothetical protein